MSLDGHVVAETLGDVLQHDIVGLSFLRHCDGASLLSEPRRPEAQDRGVDQDQVRSKNRFVAVARAQPGLDVECPFVAAHVLSTSVTVLQPGPPISMVRSQRTVAESGSPSTMA